MSHLIVLAVILPLLASPICVLLRHAAIVRIVATAVVAGTFVLSYLLTQEVASTGTISYHLGGWPPPWGIELRADMLSCVILLLITGIALVTLTMGVGKNSHTIPEGREAMFSALFLLSLTGLVGMTLTGDAFNVFVFLEISSLSSYALIALGRTRKALTAAMSYLVLGTLGGTFYLLGVGLLYQMTGTLNMADLAKLLPPLVGSRTFSVGVVFIFLGLALKLAVFPLHQWLPNAYSQAPSVVSAFLAGTATKVSYYLLLRFIFTILGASLVFEQLHLKSILMPLSLAAMFVGAAAAIFQTDFKRLLAYSSVSQLGYMTLGLSLGTKAGLYAGITHAVNHGLMKSGLFLVSAAIVAKIGSSKLDDMGSLAKKMPLTMAALVVGGLGLIGVPGTGGFISKWALVSAAIASGDIYIAGLILVSSLLAVAYVWKIVEIVYFKPPTKADDVNDEPPGVLLPAWTLLALSLVFGLFSDVPGELASAATTSVFGGVQ